MKYINMLGAVVYLAGLVTTLLATQEGQGWGVATGFALVIAGYVLENQTADNT